MEIKEVRITTENAIRNLYQNKEHEAVEQVAKLMPIYQEIVQELVVERNDTDAMVFFHMLKELVECFQVQDMLGMADCLEENALRMVQYYEQSKNAQ